jgi:sulfite reductase (NADPH) flavoprotein alpha-component
MLGEGKLKQFHQLIEGFSNEELIWINGYLAGIVANGKTNGVTQHNGHSVKPVAVKKISLVFGTETGNSKRLATNLAAVAKKKGVNVRLTALDQYRMADLTSEEYFFVVISTQGEGDPPAPAKNFYDQIHQLPIQLANVKYSVLALGDTSYPLYCKTGEDIDTQLQKLGANRVVPLQKCDVDYEEDAQQWFEQVLNILEEPSIPGIAEPVKPVAKKPAGKKYYDGIIQTNINLNDRGSNKQTFHIEIGTDENVEYGAGDAIAVIPVNKREIVEQILSLTRTDRNAVIETSKVKATTEELLIRHLNICYLLSSAVKKYAAIVQQEIPDVRIDLVDLLRIYPLKDAAQFTEVIKILSPIAPRLYSIASSPAAHGGKNIHLTVSRHSFRVKEEQRFGLCSDFLGEQPAGTPVNFYIHRNRSFKLPAADKNIILIGPGTGVAPFRSFLAERDATGAGGKNWFFFGEQHFATDFLYQAEMQNFFNTGVLTKISLAFSRDQQEKIYVQHRILEQAKELFEWIKDGAFVYISGTKDPNSKDIENVLLQVIEEQGQLSKEEARKYLKQLENEDRYEKDVY